VNIEKIIYPSNTRHYNMTRCSHIIKSSYFIGKPIDRQCGRAARFVVDGKPLCPQHAGNKCLKHLLKVQE